MRKWLLNTIATLPVLLCALVLVWSYLRTISVGYSRSATESGRLVVYATSGAVDRGWFHVRSVTVRPSERGENLDMSRREFGWTSPRFYSFAHQRNFLVPTYHGVYQDQSRSAKAGLGITSGWELTIPVWELVVVTFIPVPLVARRAWNRRLLRRRRLAGVCSTCGYDLRASGDRCPECGTVPERLVETAA
jgi:hypothetical protein